MAGGSLPRHSARRLATVLVTGATGFIGSHVARLARRARRRASCSASRTARPTPRSPTSTCRRVKLEVRDRRSVRRALQGGRARVPLRRRHLGAPAGRRAPVRRERAAARKIVMEECLRAEVERVVYTSSAAVVGPAAQGKTADETQLFTAGPARHPVRQLGARGRGGGDARGGARAAARVREPGRLLRRGRPPAHLHAAGALLPARPRAGLHRRRRVDRRRARRGRAATCSPTERGQRRRALHPRRAQLHLRPPVRRPRAGCRASTRRCGCRPGRRAPAAGAARRRAAAAGRSRRPRCSAASQWWTYRSTKARRELGWTARPHEETLEATVAWHLEREHDRIARTRAHSRSSCGWPGPRSGAAEMRRRPCCDGSPLAASLALAGHGHALPLQGAHRPGLPLRQGRAAAARARRSTSTRCACPSSSATGPRSRS